MTGIHSIISINEIKDYKSNSLIKEDWHYKKTVKYRILTLMHYVYEVEKRFNLNF